MNATPDRRRADGNRNDADAIRLLVADDDSAYATYIRALARRLGFVVDIAWDGQIAAAMLDQNTYDVAVIDLQMPQLTGFDVIRHLRSNDATKGVYAIMLTGRGEGVTTKVAALEAGFDDFMTKSAGVPELMAKLAAARRVGVRQRKLHLAIRDLYGLATRDELTGVFNRRFFVEETERMLSRGETVCIVLFDLDGFKGVNDTYGHLAGDRILRDIGALFLKNTRPEDLVARYGGDEFVMVVSGLAAAEAQNVASRVAQQIAALQWVAGATMFTINVTTGLASTQLLDQPNVDQLLEAADRDLYKNKWIRKNPDARPELYEYPPNGGGTDVVLRVPVLTEIAEEAPKSEVLPPLPEVRERLAD